MIRDTLLRLYEMANERDWKPWELQSEMKKVYEGVVAVGDDLSFTVKLEKELRLVDLKRLGGRKVKMHPFKTAWRFDKGFVAFEDRFLRISREIDKNLLIEVLNLILPED